MRNRRPLSGHHIKGFCYKYILNTSSTVEPSIKRKGHRMLDLSIKDTWTIGGPTNYQFPYIDNLSYKVPFQLNQQPT